MSGSAMSQDEIDALLNGPSNSKEGNSDVSAVNDGEECYDDYLLFQELDTIGEIGNITMGTASTPLSELLGVPVNINNPHSFICGQEKLFSSFDMPYMLIQVNFKKGLSGFNVLVIKEHDVAVITDLMMGGNGMPQDTTLDEMSLSAAAEAMNQMVGSAATALAELFNKPTEISPPVVTLVSELDKADHSPLPTDGPIVVVQFQLSIGDLLNTVIMQITGVETAKEQVAYLFEKMGVEPPRKTIENGLKKLESPNQDPDGMVFCNGDMTGGSAHIEAVDLAMNLPVRVSLVSGRILCRVADIASLRPGVLIDVPQACGYVELEANGSVVAVGELSNGKLRVINLVTSSLK